jgi:Concanavalin A-like lectin/glucanases superfamily
MANVVPISAYLSDSSGNAVAGSTSEYVTLACSVPAPPILLPDGGAITSFGFTEYPDDEVVEVLTTGTQITIRTTGFDAIGTSGLIVYNPDPGEVLDSAGNPMEFPEGSSFPITSVPPVTESGQLWPVCNPPIVQYPLLPNLSLWLKADAITGLTNGQGVATWTDQSPSGNNATQATSANRPVYTTGLQNGLPGVVAVTASDQYFNLPDGTIPYANNPHTIYAAFLTGNPVQGVLISTGNTETTGENSFLFANSAELYGNGWWGNDCTASVQLTTSTPYIMALTYDPSGVGRILYLNGVQTGTNNSTAGTGIPDTPCYMGFDVLGNPYFNGAWLETIVYSAAQTAGQVLATTNYLRRKWGI